jgi:site-specific DNA-cytosine methylase
MLTVRKNVFHMFGAIGGGAKGFKRARAEVAGLRGEWQCLGSIDIDEAANRDFERLVGVRATTMDLMDREQYRAFHGHEPPPGWREATPDDVRRAAQHQRPHAVFLSAPCKGFSGLLSEAKSRTDKYQALNRLTLRGVWLMLEAWADDPPEIVLFENVPRLATRGRALLDQITAMLQSYGYATAPTTHDCGELGELAQSRKRFLLVARHIEKVPPLLYEPKRRPLRAVGDVLRKMPLPGDLRAGPMHRVPALQWKTWVRLAFVEAGSDWRSLNKLAIEDGMLRDYLIVPAMHNGTLGVREWEAPTGTVTGNARALTGSFSVADPRLEQSSKWSDGQACGVRRWDQTTGTVSGKTMPGQGAFAVADPRCSQVRHNNVYRVVRWDRPSGTVTSSFHPTGGGGIADPRPMGELFGKYAVTAWIGATGTVISGSTTGQGAYAVADPRSGMAADRTTYLTGGHYGVVPWEATAGAVSSAACHDNGRWSVADPRMPAIDDKLVVVIRALDGTWHRPFTTLELAALQSLFDPEDPDDIAAFSLDGESDSAWRERIGNAVPPAASEAIATEILRTLLLADAGETFSLSDAPVWVRPVVAGLSVAQGEAA